MSTLDLLLDVLRAVVDVILRNLNVRNEIRINYTNSNYMLSI